MKIVFFYLCFWVILSAGVNALPVHEQGAALPRQQTEPDKQKEKEKEKEKTTTSIVVTDEDLKKLKDDKTNSITFTATDSGKTQAAETPPPTDPNYIPADTTKDYWQKLKKQFDSDIRKFENEIKGLENELNQVLFKLRSRDNPGERTQLKTRINQIHESIFAAKNMLEYLQKEIENLKEKARKKGIPPGWVR